MDYRTLYLLLRCNKEFNHLKIRQQDLSDTECMLCFYVHEHNHCTQDEVAISLKTDKAVVSKAFFSLEDKGCIRRTTDPADKRRKLVHLTPKGKRKLAELTDLHNVWLQNIMTCLSDTEREAFGNYCTRMLEAAEALLETRPEEPEDK